MNPKMLASFVIINVGYLLASKMSAAKRKAVLECIDQITSYLLDARTALQQADDQKLAKLIKRKK